MVHVYTSNESLIQGLIDDGYLKTPIIIEAFQRVDRVHFMPEEQHTFAYLNQPLPIGYGQTISQPLTVAFMLELLEPRTGEKILDIGSGSGWQTALLAYIVGKNDTEGKGKIIAIERIPELQKMTEQNISTCSSIKKSVVTVVGGDGSKGYKQEAPFDKIIAAAAATELPSAWKEQLIIGGKIVAPIGSSIYCIERTDEKSFTQKRYFGFSFVPLIEE